MTDPTVRRAIEHFLEHAETDVESVVLVLWGQEVGASTRLSRLDSADAGRELADWVARTWRSQSTPQRQAATTTLAAAVDHWRAQGWLIQDLAAGLR